MPATDDSPPVLEALVSWFDRHARELPWRADASPWRVLVSEVMLQQTPVSRVLPVFDQWMDRWPRPAELAAASPGDAIRAWGRLGYPRRALRLHAAARSCVERFGGAVPSGLADLRSLPGVGEYTAAAVATFAFGQRHAVLDTNVRRVHARWLDGVALPATAAPTSRERRRAEQLLPDDPATASRVSIAVMELGALVCTARTPDCGSCPIAHSCTWRAHGYPAWDGPSRRQSWHGTDRQCRGRLMALLRAAEQPVSATDLGAQWADAQQRERALASLLTDGLVVSVGADHYRLP